MSRFVPDYRLEPEDSRAVVGVCETCADTIYEYDTFIYCDSTGEKFCEVGCAHRYLGLRETYVEDVNEGVL